MSLALLKMDQLLLHCLSSLLGPLLGLVDLDVDGPLALLHLQDDGDAVARLKRCLLDTLIPKMR